MKLCLDCGGQFAGEGWQCPSCGRYPVERDGFICFAPELAASAGFDRDLFGVLVELESESFWFRSRNRLISWVVRRYFPDARSIFELGCGTGFVLSALREAYPAASLTASDIGIEGLPYARTRVPDAAIFQIDGRAVPFADEFDLVTAFDVLEHVDDDRAVLRELWRSLRAGGGIVVTVPQHPRLWSAADEFASHERRYTRRELVAKLRDAGFELVRVTGFVSVLLPLVVVGRMRKQSPVRYDIRREHVFPRPVTMLLEALLGAERAALKRGLSLPFGTSLLVVARKPATS